MIHRHKVAFFFLLHNIISVSYVLSESPNKLNKRNKYWVDKCKLKFEEILLKHGPLIFCVSEVWKFILFIDSTPFITKSIVNIGDWHTLLF